MAEINSKFGKHLLITCLIAGTMDISAATIQFVVKTGKSPILIFQYISSAIFGKEAAYSGDLIYPILGLLFHYMIASIWATIFYLLYLRLSFLRLNQYVVGIGYGIFVWTMMNRVVVPLSKIGPSAFNLSNAIQAAFILIVCIGLPISIRAHRFYSNHLG